MAKIQGVAVGESEVDETVTESDDVKSVDPDTDEGGDEKTLTFTQEEFDRALAKNAAKARRQALRDRGRQDDAPPTSKTKATDNSDAFEQMRKASALLQFTLEVGDHGISAKQAKKLHPIYESERPEDLEEWIGGLQSTLGWSPVQKSQTAGAGKVEDKAPAKNLAGGAPRKVADLERDGVIDVFRLTREERAQLGPAGVVREFEKLRDMALGQSGAPPLPKALRRK